MSKYEKYFISTFLLICSSYTHDIPPDIVKKRKDIYVYMHG